jgi:hypothetical protein
VLREIKEPRQERGVGRRRWFESDGLDLVVWLDTRGAVTGFQLCYDFGRGEYALTWRAAQGFAHATVDQGDDWQGGAKKTPVLVPSGAVPWTKLADLFHERSSTLEPALRHLVATELADGASA